MIVLDSMRVFAFAQKKAPGGLPAQGLPHFPNSLALEVHSCWARIQIRVTACPARIVSERNSQLARFQVGIQKTPSKFGRDLRGWIFRCQASKRGYVTIRPRPVLHDVHLPESLRSYNGTGGRVSGGTGTACCLRSGKKKTGRT